MRTSRGGGARRLVFKERARRAIGAAGTCPAASSDRRFTLFPLKACWSRDFRVCVYSDPTCGSVWSKCSKVESLKTASPRAISLAL